MKLHEDIFIKNEFTKLKCLVMQSSERGIVSVQQAFNRVATSYERALNGAGMHHFGEGKFCFESGFVTDSGECIVCYCVPNRFNKHQAFCVGFAKASDYGLNLSKSIALTPQISFFDRVVALFRTKVF